ncbi:MAG: hypothetical protein LBG58_04670 [Planctomycetaceae bacterium]|jgi:asparagine N-glycosylation enzyme membrane subunit Stt3|nr:hypothetical protein [Planctomycetaceae bacterium]
MPNCELRNKAESDQLKSNKNQKITPKLLNTMGERPKLNKVAVDDQPEPKPKKEKDYIPYLIVLAAILCRLILDCCGFPAPLITSWTIWWITIVIMVIGAGIALDLEKKYANDKIPHYYVCACTSLWGLLIFHVNPASTFMFIILIILGTSCIFQFLLTKK